MEPNSMSPGWATLIVAIAGWVATIAAAIVGARLGGKYVKDGVLLAAQKESEAARDRSRLEISNLRKAILTEIEALLERYMEGVGNLLEETPENQPLLMIYSTYQRYFVVFEENAHLLGQIPDDKERELIVKGYTLAKGLLDSYQMNTSYTEKHGYVSGLGPTLLAGKHITTQIAIEEVMRAYTPILKKMHSDLLAICDQLRQSLQQPIDWEKKSDE